jgi:hypothetical protein
LQANFLVFRAIDLSFDHEFTATHGTMATR